MTGSRDDLEHIVFRQRLQVFMACCNAGRGIVERCAGDPVNAGRVAEVAVELGRFADRAQAAVQAEFRPAIACHAGCSYCCRKPGVLISISELLRLLDHVRHVFTEEEQAALKTRAARYVERLAGRDFNAPVRDSVTCPFLVDDRCAAYVARPLACRGYNSLSVQACREADVRADRSVPIFTLLKDVTDGATLGAGQALKAAGVRDAMLDLGTALFIALNASDDVVEALLSGGRPLAAAEEPSMLEELWSQVCRTARQAGLVADWA